MNHNKLLTGKELKQERINRNLSQEDLAKLTGICRKTISVWEVNGEQEIKKPHSLLLQYLFNEHVHNLRKILFSHGIIL